MPEPTMTAAERIKAYRAAKDLGHDDRTASSIAYPGAHPDVAMANGQAIGGLPGQATSDMMSNPITSSVIATDGIARRISEDHGIDLDTAKANVSEAISNLPDPGAPAQYDKFDMWRTMQRKSATSSIVGTVSGFKEVKSDFSLAAAAMSTFPMNLQQGLFGALAGESPTSIAARLWPKAIIRDEEGNEERKALIPLAIKGAALSFLGNTTRLFNSGIPTAGGQNLIQLSREAIAPILISDYNEGLLGGLELSEYVMFNQQRLVDWANGTAPDNPLYFEGTPDIGTPERAAYDQMVRENSAQNWAMLMDNHPKWWKIAHTATTIGALATDIFVDPLLISADLPVKAVDVLRKTVPASSSARVWTAIADKSRRLEDLINASNEARKWADKALETYKKAPTEENLARLIHARKNFANVTKMKEAAGQPAEAVRIVVTPKIRPEHIESLGNKFLDAPDAAKWATAKNFVADQVKNARREMKRVEQAIERVKGPEGEARALFPDEALGEDLKTLQAKHEELKRTADEWRETGRWLRERAGQGKSDPSRTSAYFKSKISNQVPYESGAIRLSGETDKAAALREIQNNINRGFAQDAPIEEIRQWERTFSDINKNGIPEDGVIVRNNDSIESIIQSSQAEQRLKAIDSDPMPVVDYTKAGPEQFEQRVAFGPDDSEAASEAARILAAGGEIDDVAYYGLPLGMYNSSYGLQLRPHSGTEGRALAKVAEKTLAAEAEWVGEAPFKTAIEAAQWQQTLGEKMGDFWAKSLHPKAWNVRPAAVIYKNREVMRVLQSTHPRLYTRIRNALESQSFETERMFSVFSRELRNLGVHKVVGGVVHVDKANTKKFFQIMNMDPTGDEYIKAIAGLTESERRSIQVIRQELDFMAQKLGIEGTAKEITGYIHHVFDHDSMGNAARPFENLGMPAGTRVFNPSLLNRSGGGGYIEDLSMTLDTYGRYASRKLHIEPLLEDLKFEAERILAKNPDEAWLANYIENIHRNIKGEPTTLGRAVDGWMSTLNARFRADDKLRKVTKAAGFIYEKTGKAMESTGETLAKVRSLRPVAGQIINSGIRTTDRGSYLLARGVPMYQRGDVGRTAMGVSALAYSSVLGGSSHYFPMATATGLATTGGRYGVFKTAESILTMGTAKGRRLAAAAGLDKMWPKILEDSRYTTVGRLASELPTFNGVTGVAPSIHATENLIRGWTFHAAVSDMIRKAGYSSWEEVVKAGKANQFVHEGTRITEEVNHLFGLLGKPAGWTRMSKSGSVAATQFLSFVPKQMEELLSQALRNPGHIGRYMMISGYIQRIGAKTGIDMSDYVGMGFLPKSPDEASSIAIETAKSMFRANYEMSAMLGPYGDETRAGEAVDDYLRNLENFIPLSMTAKRAGTSLETLRLGAVFSGGRKKREVDLGQFKWDPQKSFFENWKSLPKGLVSENSIEPHPTELAATLMGMRSPEARLEMEDYAARLSIAKKRMRQRKDLQVALEDAFLEGNNQRFNDLFEAAIRDGLIDPVNFDKIDQTSMKIALPRLLRTQIDTDQALIDDLESMQRNKLIYQMRFGR